MPYNWQSVAGNLPQFNAPHAEIIVLERTVEQPQTIYKIWRDENCTLYASSNEISYYKLVGWTDDDSVFTAIRSLHLGRNLLQTIPRPEVRVDWFCGEIPSTTRQNCRSTKNRHRTYIIPVPFVSFKKSATCMADKDLKLTRVAILRCLRKLNHNSSRRSIDAIEAWRGYEQALIRYGIQVALECKRRGFADKSLEKLQTLLTTSWEKPKWIYCKQQRESYQSYLKLQDYRRYIWRILNWFWMIDRYIRRNYHSIHQLICDEWGYDPYNLTFSELKSLEHRVRQLVVARQEFLSPYASFYSWPVESCDICYSN